ncbi:DUF4199 domain-containing protein [Dyadobacter pollutisoli]|jgi:hypothetical protein|uniref:DUF4199 domain-containing protein n=1 Tax=Dyadobacter pollutisoli TaxID=2910158 RepID=A0A9E8NAH1_9BACT|nr:DUF4199 domain-containing protein [Dyadobacter pollutisoli]WAC11758.1 DUF4199 domain-containing protein [Dyadobacter pollutisoli]
MKSIIAYFNKPILKISLLFGLATGLLVFVFFLGLYLMDIVPLGNNKILDFGIHIILIAGACWYYRKKVGNGFLHLWEALTIGYVVNTIGALIAGWLIYFFVTYIDPSVFTNYLGEMKTLMLAGKAELVKNIGEAEFAKMYNGVGSMERSEIIMDEVSKKTVMAIIPILVISLIFRKQDYGLYQNK